MNCLPDPRIYKSLVFLAAVLIAVSWLPGPVYAQEASGNIVGTVLDATGARVPNVRVTITEVATNRSRTVDTNGSGDYQVPYLLPGGYTVTAEHAGFQKTTTSGITLNVSQTVRVDLRLEVGTSTQNVEVRADAVQLQTESTAMGETINRETTADLPLNGRSFAQLAELVPGVSPAVNSDITLRRNRGSMGTSIAIQVNGFASTQNMYSYDGVPAMDLDSYSFSFSPSIDAIQEFHVVTSNYTAEYGGAPGAFVDLATKSGTGKYHGTLWEFNRNNDFSARNAFNNVNQRLNRNQFGGNLGGPVPKLRQKLFYFFNWESGRQVAGTASTLVSVAPPAYRNGDFSSTSTLIYNPIGTYNAATGAYNPAAATPFPNNMIPTSLIRPASTAFESFTPLPTLGGAGNNLRTPTLTTPTQENQYIPRVDYYAGSKDSFFFRYMFNTLTTNTVLPTFGGDQDDNNGRTQNMAINYTHIITPTWVVNGLAAWDRFFETEEFGSTGVAKYNIACGLMQLPGVSCTPYNYGAPSISNGFTNFTNRTNGPRTRLNQLWDFDVKSSIQKEKHLIKFGARAYKYNWTFNESLYPRGVYSFSGTETSGPNAPVASQQFADFLLGLSSAVNVNPTSLAARLNDWNTAFFVQDDWRATPHLTVNFGVRWDYFGRPLEEGNPPAFDNFALGNGFGRAASMQFFPGQSGYPQQLVYNSYRNWGPRVGLSWNPGGGKTVVRAGWGMYYSPEITNSYTDLAFNPPFSFSITASGTRTNPIQYDSAAALATLVASAGALGAYGVDPHIRDSQISQWNLSVEHQLPSSILLSVAYVGNEGHFLTTGWNANRPILIDQPAVVRPLPTFGTVTEYGSIGDSNFHAFQFQLRKAMSNGVTFISAFTQGHALGTVDGNSFGTGDGAVSIQNIYNLRNSYSDLNFDIRTRESTSVLYNLPILRNSKGWVHALGGGWRVGSIISLQTGPAAGVGYGVDTTNTTIGSLPDEIGVPVLPHSQRTAAHWFNTAAFAAPPNYFLCGACGRFGDASRMEIHNPGTQTVDLSASKTFQIRESVKIDFRAEFFNGFNHVNLGSVSTGLTSSTFGTIGSSYPARVGQFGMKFSF